MLKSALYLSAVLVAAGLTGCAHQAPRYPTNHAAAIELKEAGLAPVTVGSIVKTATKGAKKDVDKLTIRGGILQSPYGSYTEYFRAALRDELDHAELLKDNADVTIEGVLLRNEIDASGVSIGYAEIEAQLIVKRNGTVQYEGTKSARHEWESSFVGAVAIPRAISGYPITVRKVLAEFYADKKFIAALKKQ
jgi:hypothetical protein